mmetsp:Transcript_83589/g.102444  ORF Transcript_83589/g.102444 Transcript_83589/m.102444 type:complete len:185 (-) Transcript_83589:28-582(-)
MGVFHCSCACDDSEEKQRLLDDKAKRERLAKIYDQNSSFRNPYRFDKTREFVLLTKKDTYLAVNSENMLQMEATATNVNEFCWFECLITKTDDDNGYAQLKNLKSSKFIRIYKPSILSDDLIIDIQGSSINDKYTKFKYHKANVTYVKIESNEYSGKYISISDDGKVIISDGNDNNSLFRARRE